jgi:hypothetical protein
MLEHRDKAEEEDIATAAYIHLSYDHINYSTIRSMGVHAAGGVG